MFVLSARIIIIVIDALGALSHILDDGDNNLTYFFVFYFFYFIIDPETRRLVSANNYLTPARCDRFFFPRDYTRKLFRARLTRTRQPRRRADEECVWRRSSMRGYAFIILYHIIILLYIIR